MISEPSFGLKKITCNPFLGNWTRDQYFWYDCKPNQPRNQANWSLGCATGATLFELYSTHLQLHGS